MVRVVRLTAGHLVEGLPADLPGDATYHADPSHPSFGRVPAHVLALPSEGIAEGVILLPESDATPLGELIYVVDRLLGPGGCPWDHAQTHESLKTNLLEEAYEVIDAIDEGDMPALCEELGDLLLQPVMHAQMERLNGTFSIDDVARGIVDKLVRRHPHVFGNSSATDADEVLQTWDAIKREEKGAAFESILSGIPRATAALLRAHTISKRAARAGFEWPDLNAVFEKLREEELELREAISGGDAAHIESEVGDLLFTAVNLARWAGVEPEEALRKMLDRFSARFQYMESAAGVPLNQLSPESWETHWSAAKLSVG